MRIIALIKRIIQQMLRDKRTLGLLFFAPLLMLTLMYFVFNGAKVDPKLGVIDLSSPLILALEKTDITVVEYDDADTDTVKADKLDGLLKSKNGTLSLILLNNDPAKSKSLQMKVSQVSASMAQMSLGAPQSANKVPVLSIEYIYGNADSGFFDVLSPILVGFFVFFFVFLISGIGLLRERTTGTLERLMSTPIRRREVVAGYLVGYGIFAVIQTVLVVTFSVVFLKIVLVGSIWLVVLTNLLLALVALSLGIFLSTFAASEFQMIQFIPIAIIPQIFFAGIFPYDGMSKWLQALGRIMPLYYGADALKGVMYKGWGFSDIAKDLAVLTLFAAFFIVLNIIALKKYRKL